MDITMAFSPDEKVSLFRTVFHGHDISRTRCSPGEMFPGRGVTRARSSMSAMMSRRRGGADAQRRGDFR